MSHVLVLEIYRDYGMKIEDAVNELQTRLTGDYVDQPQGAARPKRGAPDEAASMAMLQAMMGGSDFRGP